MRFRALLGAAAAALAVAAPLRAQRGSLLVGGAHARYADTVAGSGGTLGGRLAWTSARARAALEGSLTQFTTGERAGQAAGSLLGLGVVRGTWGAGLIADGRASALAGGTWSAAASAGVLVAVAFDEWLASAGVSLGGVRRVEATADATLGGTVRLRYERGEWGIEAGGSLTRAGAIAFADFTLGVQFRGPLATVGAMGGVRSGDLAEDPWLQGFAELRASRWLQLEGAVGSYPRDLMGFTGGFFVSLGVRLGAVGLRPPNVETAPRSAAARRAVVLERISADTVRVTFVVPGAVQVAIAGEWNAWSPEPLQALGEGRWGAVLRLRPGAHRFSLVVDGGRWFVPRGVPMLPDDFGGSVGLLVVGS